MVLSSQGKKEEKIESKLNNYIITLQLQKINYEGVEGFFIPFNTGYKRLLFYLNDYIYYQDLIVIKDERIKKLEKLEMKNFKVRTALGISISCNVGEILLCSALGILCWNLARYSY